MAFRYILKRIKRLEDRNQEEGIVILICLENGKERRKSMTTYEAQMLVLNQGMGKTLGSDLQLEVVGVESGDDDGFIEAMLSTDDMTLEELMEIIEE